MSEQVNISKLRLGDIVSLNGEPTILNLDQFIAIQKGDMKVEGVRIDEDWLIALGLENIKGKGRSKVNFWYHHDIKIRFALMHGEIHATIGDDENGFAYQRFFYVHQLQQAVDLLDEPIEPKETMLPQNQI